MKVSGTDLSMVRGDTESILVTVDNYTFMDGDKVEMMIRKRASSPIVLFRKEVTTFEDNTALIRIEHEETQNFTFGDYVYDIQLTMADGTVVTIIEESIFTMKPEVTYDYSNN